MSSGLRSKKTPSFKWPFPFSFLKIYGQHRSSDPCTMQIKLGSLRSNVFNGLLLLWFIRTTDEWIPTPEDYFQGDCLHGGGGPQTGEVTCGGSPHLSCKSDHIKMRDNMDRRATLTYLESPTSMWTAPKSTTHDSGIFKLTLFLVHRLLRHHHPDAQKVLKTETQCYWESLDCRYSTSKPVGHGNDYTAHSTPWNENDAKCLGVQKKVYCMQYCGRRGKIYCYIP